MSFLAHYISKTTTLNACFLILACKVLLFLKRKKKTSGKRKNHKGNLTLLNSQYK